MDYEPLRLRLSRRAPARGESAGRREAAVALVVAGPAPELLLIRRCEHPEDPWSGQMAFPGGRRDEGEADLFETACREALEETGVRLSRACLLGELDDLCPTNPALPPVLVRPFVFGLPERPEVTPSGEVAGHLWVPLSALEAGEAEVPLRGKARKVRGYRVGEAFVWGMTERMLTQFLELARR